MHLFRSPMNSQLGFEHVALSLEERGAGKGYFSLFGFSSIWVLGKFCVPIIQRRSWRYIQVERAFLTSYRHFPSLFIFWFCCILSFLFCWCPFHDPPAVRPPVPQTSLSRLGFFFLSHLSGLGAGRNISEYQSSGVSIWPADSHGGAATGIALLAPGLQNTQDILSAGISLSLIPVDHRYLCLVGVQSSKNLFSLTKV